MLTRDITYVISNDMYPSLYYEQHSKLYVGEPTDAVPYKALGSGHEETENTQ